MKATQGKQYTIVKGDTLSGIALQAYGRGSKWRIIWNANKTTLRSGSPHLIYPGEIITIPTDREEQKAKDDLKKESKSITQKKEGIIKLVINGSEVNFSSIRCLKDIASLSDYFSFTIDSDSNKEIGLVPFGFENVEIFIDDEKIINGYIYKISSSFSGSGAIINAEGYNGSIDIIDSNCEPPYEFKNKTLFDICKSLCEPFGNNVIDLLNDTYKFKKVTIEKTERIGEFLLKIAKQRGALLRSNFDGDIEITEASENEEHIGSITEDDILNSNDHSIVFDSRQRFSKYRSSGKGPAKNINHSENDSNISRVRIKTTNADETTSEKIKDHCLTEKNRSIGNAISLQYSSDGFYTNENKLYKENKTISIESGSLFLVPGSSYLTKSIEFTANQNSTKTKIELVLPQVYNRDTIKEEYSSNG